MPGRGTADPKDSTLKLRLNDRMREHVVHMAAMHRISMSEYIRTLIRRDMRDTNAG